MRSQEDQGEGYRVKLLQLLADYKEDLGESKVCLQLSKFGGELYDLETEKLLCYGNVVSEKIGLIMTI